MPCIFLVFVRVLTGGLEGESPAFLFPLRGTGKRNRGIYRMCAPVDERALGAFDEDSKDDCLHFFFPLRGTKKRNRGIYRMCAPVDERAPGAFDEDSIPFEQNKKATEW